MVDVVDKKTRSRMMAGIRGKNTRPELAIRSALFRAGFRYRLHATHLRGKPDLVFPKYQSVVFVHGCFWHGHKCALFKWPSSNKEFWREKIEKNRANDVIAKYELGKAGWRIGVVWECAFRGRRQRDIPRIAFRLAKWLKISKGRARFLEIS
jgi:DNA mismatch endonuclease (patch repair protein)